MLGHKEVAALEDDDEFIKSVAQRRDYIEKITLIATLLFLTNTLITFAALKFFLTNTANYSYKFFLTIYVENVLCVAGIIYVFNKYKF